MDRKKEINNSIKFYGIVITLNILKILFNVKMNKNKFKDLLLLRENSHKDKRGF